MMLTGLPLGTLLAIFGGAAALTVVLYILRLRRRPVAVPFAPLWHSVLGDRDASRLFSRLRRWISLLLQLVLLALLAFALGDPRPTGSLGNGRNVVLLIDASASMQATDEKPTRLEAAKAKARELVQGLGGSDRALVVQMGDVPVPLSTLSDSPSELLQAIARVKASDTRAELGRALELGSDALRGAPHGEIVVFSDGALPEPSPAPNLAGARLRFVPVGKSGKNLAITAFSVRRYPLDKSRLEVLAEIANTSKERAEVELSLWGDGAIIDSERLHVEPGARLSRFFSDVGGTRRGLEARLRYADGTSDDLPADDRAYALVPERRRARILVVTAGNTYLEAALLLDEYLDVTDVKPSKYPPPGRFDATIFDGVAPPPARDSGGLIYLNPPVQGSPVKVGKAITEFGFDTWDRKSRVLRFAALGDVQVAAGHAFEPQSDDKVLGASDDGPIMVAGTRSSRPFIALGFDPRQSDLVLRPAWPLVVLNAIDSFSETDASYLSAYRTGEVWRVPVQEGAREAELTLPDGTRRPVPVQDGRAVTFGERAGVYKLATGTDETRLVTEFAANLADPDESQILPHKTLSVAGQAAPPPEPGGGGVRRELWLLLVAVALCLSLVEWFTYHRRITV
ncbi:MAG TPA: VWA domain-containing protein [Polyangiaceae bacterium]|nr:VWA domain-containing protein [Polyangiaceae bacterium]